MLHNPIQHYTTLYNTTQPYTIMKKILTILALAISAMTMMAETLHIGNLYYEIIPIEGRYCAEVIPHRSYKKLKKLEIPESITYQGVTLPITIGNSAFNGCKSLASITISNSVISIGYDAFEGTAIYKEQSYWENGALCIDGCLIKASQYIPNTYTISDDIRVIADCAFSSCPSITSITIPNSVTSIGRGAFKECTYLQEIYFTGSMKQWEIITENWSKGYSTDTPVICTDGTILIDTDPYFY